MNLTDLTLAEASRKLRDGMLSSLELTTFMLNRAAALNQTLNAFITITREEALTQARQADDERAQGLDRGPLHGVPIALKDLFETRGIRTTAGSKILSAYVPTQDAAVTARLRNAGAVLVGKTNMHEWAFGVTNDNPHFGRVCNPWATDRVPGGSSGGSAVAVAARMCLGALGSDTGGSIRIPSSFCGITGLKPTYGRVSLRGVIPLSWTMDHVGPMAQTAQDCALLLQAIAGYDPLDPASRDVPVSDYAAELDRPLNGIVLALPSGYFAEQVDGEILTAVEQAVRILVRDGAVTTVKALPFGQELYQVNRTILPPEAAAFHQQEMEQRPEDFGADVMRRLQGGTRISVQDYARARRRRDELQRALAGYLTDVDLLVTPTTRIAAPPFSIDPVVLSQNTTVFTAPFNAAGFPALSLPCGLTREGLPIGMQLVGRPWEEGLLLHVAHRYQQATDWHRRQPPLP